MRNEKKKNRRDHVVSTRISREEMLSLEKTALSRNKSISDLVREALHVIAPPVNSYLNSSYSEGRHS